MKYAIDRIEDNIATLENIDNNEIINIDINNLPKNIKEGTRKRVDSRDKKSYFWCTEFFRRRVYFDGEGRGR